MTFHPKNLLQMLGEADRFCGECRLFHKPECRYAHVRGEKGLHVVLATDRACEDFKPKGKRGEKGDRRAGKGEWKLDLDAYVPPSLKPCGFYGDTLNEAVWLPYQKQKGNVALRPSVVTAKKDSELQIIDYLATQTKFKGVFPSQDMTSLMSVKAVKMLKSKTKIDPHAIDAEIDEAFNKHLEIPKAERILAKRWIEGTFFYDIFDAYPIESILGVSESGKSRLCLLNLALCYHAEGLIDPTEATIFRSKEEDRVSLIIDEAEYLRDPRLFKTIKILLNASYSKHSGFVSRYDEQDGKRVKMRFDLYSPMCISGIAGLGGITLSRAFRLVMRRVDKDYPKANPNDYRLLRDKLYVLRIRHCFDVEKIYRETDISNVVSARFEELFRPLFAMTSFMGSKEEDELMQRWCRDYQQNFRLEALNVSEEEQVLICLSQLQSKSLDPYWIGLKQLADAVNSKYTRNVKSKTISNVLYRLGLTKRKKLHGYIHVYAPKEVIEEAASRIGISSSLRSPTSPNSLSPPSKKNMTLSG